MIIEKFKNFTKIFQNKSIVFALIYANVKKSTTNENLILKDSKQTKNFELQFDDKITKILIDKKDSYYVIDLINKQKSLFIFLYNLFQKKLTKLQRYLKNALIKN